MKKIFPLLFLALLSLNVNSQTYFNSVFNDTNYEEYNSIVKINSGGYLALGTTSSSGAGTSDLLLSRLDNEGNLLWSKTYGALSDDFGITVAENPLGGFLLMGYTYSYSPGQLYDDILLISTDSNGIVKWSKIYGGLDYDEGNDMRVLSNGTIVVSGLTSSYGTTIQSGIAFTTNNLGVIQNSKVFSQNPINYFNSVLPTSDGGFVFAGSTTRQTSLNFDGFVVKTDGNLNVTWAKRTGTQGIDFLNRSAENTSSNLIAITGTTSSGTNGGTDVVVMTLNNANGNSVNTKYYGGPFNDRAYDIFYNQLSSTYTLSGYYSYINSSTDTVEQNLGFEIDELTGSVIWSAIYGDEINGSRCLGSCIDQNSLVQCGSTFGYGAPDGQAQIIKNNGSQLAICGRTNIGLTPQILTTIDSVGANSSSINITTTNVALTGVNYILSSTVNCTNVGVFEKPSAQQLKVFPNPTCDFINIELENLNTNYLVKITDISGRLILVQNTNNRNSRINVKDFETGLYIITLIHNDKTYMSKFIKR